MKCPGCGKELDIDEGDSAPHYCMACAIPAPANPKPRTVLPRLHDFLAAGIPHAQAMAWHEAIMMLESHAKTLAETMELNNSTEYFKIRNFKEAHKHLTGGS